MSSARSVHVKHLRMAGVFGRGLEHSSAPPCPPAPTPPIPRSSRKVWGLPNSERCTATVLERPYIRPCIAIQPPPHLYPSQSRAGVAQRVDPSAEPAWPNESMPWRVVPTCTSRRQRWRTCPSLLGTGPNASLPFTRSCCTSRHALPYAPVAIALVVALAVTVAVDLASS
jgi:hypothetical protein